VASAIAALEPIGMSGATVLIKPNLLLAFEPERAATTHPAVVRALIRAAKAAGAAKILVGDSPGWQGLSSVAAKTGMSAVVREEGAAWADFSEGVSVDLPEGSLIRRFELAKAVVEADLVINAPKLKTHGLMYYTGAVKNLFGCIPGLKKSAFHLRFPGRAEFAAMLADLYLAVKPELNVMDAIVAMEGAGPSNGRPRDIGLVLASRSAFALDWLAAGIIGYHPADVPYLGLAARDERYGLDTGHISWVGQDPAARRAHHFERVKVLKETDFFRTRMPAWMHGLARNLSVPRPFFSDRLCVRCGGCVKICPAQCLSFQEGAQAPRVDYGACIRCYCCHEVCPADAISLARRP
jgi:uncharacterized protein (DUF362 family)/Pyruvate/2-oxoacid:ferredoxin oxidoreductase delta subunit